MLGIFYGPWISGGIEKSKINKKIINEFVARLKIKLILIVIFMGLILVCKVHLFLFEFKILECENLSVTMYCKLDYKLVGASEKFIENFKKTKLIIEDFFFQWGLPIVNPPPFE